MNDIIITPANIISVVIQYKPNNTYPQGLFSNPSIVVAFDNNGITQYQQIDLGQILTYIKMLELKAAINAVGEVVLAIQSTPNGEQFTKIQIGQPVVPPPVTGTINFKVNGVNFAIGNALTNVVNLTGAGVADRGIDNTPFVVEFSLPQFTDNFFADYLITTTVDLFTYQAIGNGTTWDVIATGMVNTGGAKTVDFAAQPMIKFVTTGLIGNVVMIDNAANQYLVKADTFYLPASANYFAASINSNFWGSFNISQFIGGIIQPAETHLNAPIGNLVPALGVDEIHLDADLIEITNNGNGFGNPVTIPFFTRINNVGATYFTLIQGTPPSVTDVIKYGAEVISYNFGSNNPADGTYRMTLLDAVGTILQTFDLVCDGSTHSVAYNNPASLYYKFIDFYVVAPASGIPVNAAGKAAVTTGLCTQALTTYYTVTGSLTTGDTVFTDAAMTTPLAGFDFILSPDGVIYAINNVTGLVGAASGSTCNIPITGKNLQVIGTASTHFSVDGVDYGAKIAGTNYNIVIRSDSVITNSVGAGRTLNFYVSPPFIGANLTPGSGSPAAIANAGTYTLPNNIANYNYVVVT